MDWLLMFRNIKNKDIKSLSRAISLVENEINDYYKLLEIENISKTKIIGITGPPGAGKSSLTDKLIEQLILDNKTIGVVCIDPSSPFNLGAILGDRLRMYNWYLNKNVFIRSLASRGALGGLNPKIVEIIDIMKIADFDYIIIETVGVGQSEIDVVGLADTTIVVLVPESGDEIQTMKSGLMEIADIFVINKCDRPLADLFYHNLKLKLSPIFSKKEDIDIIKTSTTLNIGLQDLKNSIYKNSTNKKLDFKIWNYTNKSFEIIQKNKMKNINKNELFNKIKIYIEKNNNFNLYKFTKSYID